jgi:hypothetical protein
MGEQHLITDAEVLAVCGGVDDATGQHVVVLTLRPITGSGWGHVNFALSVENAHSLHDSLGWALNPACGPLAWWSGRPPFSVAGSWQSGR